MGSYWSNPEQRKAEILKQAEYLRSQVLASTATGSEKNAQVGQYLHFMQDIYYHQDDKGLPLDRVFGHGPAGHEPDYCATSYTACVRANQTTYDILQKYKDNNTLPAVPSAKDIWVDQATADRMAANIKANNPIVARVSDAISNSYKSSTITVSPEWKVPPTAAANGLTAADLGIPDEKITKWALDKQALKTNLADAYKASNPGGGSYDPLTEIDGKKFKQFDYDQAQKSWLLQYPGASQTTNNKPGGISLSWAVANRMALDLNMDAFHAESGRVVLSGNPASNIKLDSGLFMTAMRLACDGRDPYFSLDPDDGRLWVSEGEQASDEIWKRIESDLHLKGNDYWNHVPDGLRFRSFSVKRDYPQVWSTIKGRYPNFKTRLVFKPEWLRQTRFGEIFYIADILLKELAAGVPTVAPGDAQLRALSVGNYVSARQRAAAERLLANIDKGKLSENIAQGTRFWFDLVPRSKSHLRSMLDDDRIVPAAYRPSSPLAQQLDSQLAAMGARGAARRVEPVRLVATNKESFDLSQVYPTMFIIGHDNKTGQDVNGDDPYNLAVAEDVNTRIARYVDAYRELRELRDAFRLYVAAVAIVKKDNSSCAGVRKLPLFPVERASRKLPEHHASELHFTVASFSHRGADGGKKSWWSSANYYSGGVSPGGKGLLADAREAPTALTKTVQEEVVGETQKDTWRGKSGRNYAAVLTALPEAMVDEMRRLREFEPSTKAMFEERMKKAGVTLPSPTPAPKPSGGGLLDDIDPNTTGVIRVPR